MKLCAKHEGLLEQFTHPSVAGLPLAREQVALIYQWCAAHRQEEEECEQLLREYMETTE